MCLAVRLTGIAIFGIDRTTRDTFIQKMPQNKDNHHEAAKYWLWIGYLSNQPNA
jgi:hypothetical protein